MCVFKQQLMGLITSWIDLCFNFMDDITQLSPDGIIGMKHCQRTLDTKKVSQCNPFSTVIIFVLASDTCTEAQTHSSLALFSIYLRQWKDFHRFQKTWTQCPTTLHSFQTFTYGVSYTLKDLITVFFVVFSFGFSPCSLSPTLPPHPSFFPSLCKHLAAAVWTHHLWLIKHRQIKLKLFSLGKTEKILIPVTVYIALIFINLMDE